MAKFVGQEFNCKTTYLLRDFYKKTVFYSQTIVLRYFDYLININ